jgi:ParB family transcriptional regulator, chromosome partitioning protein
MPPVPRETPQPEIKPQPTKRLGRGLAHLLAAEVPSVTIDTPRAAPSTIPLDHIRPGKFQPRKQFDEASLSGLAESIRHSGVMQPIVVRPVAGAGPSFEIVAGERRWRAARLAGLTEIPAIQQALSDLESAEWSVAENLQRADLNPIEKAWSLRGLVENFGLTQDQIAQRLGIERSSVSNMIRLTELEPEIAEMVVGGQLSAGHGKALLALSPGMGRMRMAKLASEGKWSVRQIEAAIRRAVQGDPSPVPNAEPDPKAAVLADLERQLGQYLGTKVQIRAGVSHERGSIQVDFYGLDHFDGLLRKMGFDRA